MSKREPRTTFVKEVEPGIGLYKYEPDNPEEDGTLRYMPGNPQGRQAGGSVALASWMKPIKTTERALELNERGREKKQQAIEKGIQRAVEQGQGITLSGPTEALQYIAAAQTNIAMNPDAGMPSVKAAELLFKAVDALPDPRYQLQAQAIKVEIHVDGGAIAAFERQEAILDGTFREVE